MLYLVAGAKRGRMESTGSSRRGVVVLVVVLAVSALLGGLYGPLGARHGCRPERHAGFGEELHARPLRGRAQLRRPGGHRQGDLRWRDPRHAPRARSALKFLRSQAIRALPRRTTRQILRRGNDGAAARESDRGACAVRRLACVQSRHSSRRYHLRRWTAKSATA